MKNLDKTTNNTKRNFEEKEELYFGKYRKIDIIHKLLGVLLIIIALFIFVFFTIWILISKLKTHDQQEDSSIINFIINDKHYCIALPILIPFSMLILYFKWLAYNYFKYC